MEGPIREQRNELFLELKPCCVKLSQLALKDDGSSHNLKGLKETTSQLLDILNEKCQNTAAFDEKLADYVFFPLSQVLRRCQNHPDRLAELATQCLRVLLEHGWRMINIDLAQQLIVLLTFFASGGQTTLPVAEELQSQAYGALVALFGLLRTTPKGSTSLVDASAIPSLAHCLTVILDGVTKGPSSQVQYEATAALKSFWSCIKDRQALADFFPGTVSALTRCLTPNTATPRSRGVLINSLEALQVIITSMLNDIATSNLLRDSEGPKADNEPASLTKSWLRATGSQIKLALASIVKLRNHSHLEVRKALLEFCLAILDECIASLADCMPLLVETAMTLENFDQEIGRSYQRTSLKDLASIHQSIFESVRLVTYNWITSLPRLMQSSDETIKQTALQRLSGVIKMYPSLELSSEILTKTLSNALHDSVVSILQTTPAPNGAVSEVAVSCSLNLDLLPSSQISFAKLYSPILMPLRNQVETRKSLHALIAGIGLPDMRIRVARSMLELVPTLAGNDLLAAIWLAFQLIKSAKSSTLDLEVFISLPSIPTSEMEAAMLELYSYSMSFISDETEEEVDWRMQALSLEIIAYNAEILQKSFRPDLVDVLYPVVHLLGSAKPQLREHAIVSLNLISKSCGYLSTSEMIVKNVDYLINAIALKLDSFDISPQAPQVLIMMLQLSGSSLLSYLDDIVVSIFAALDNFHGYAQLVDGLFTFLGEIVQKSRESSQLLVTGNSDINHRKRRAAKLSIDDIVIIFKKKVDIGSISDEGSHCGFSQEPQKSATMLLTERDNPKEGAVENEEPEPAVAESTQMPPSKAYLMVQSITKLSQHYLTNQSPFLRQNLLHLIRDACQTLYRDEDQFLPLVNDIWPVLIKRLYDKESYVVIAAVKAVAEVCMCVGDFISGRIQVEWQDIMRSVREAKAKALEDMQGRRGDMYSQNMQVWEAFIQLLLVITQYVRINDVMFDEILEVLAKLLASRADIHAALSALNADAVWLEEFRQAGNTYLKPPEMEGFKFANVNHI